MALPAALVSSGTGIVGVASAADADLPNSVADFGFLGGFAAAVAGFVLWLDRRGERIRDAEAARTERAERKADEAEKRADEAEAAKYRAELDALAAKVASRDAEIAARDAEIAALQAQIIQTTNKGETP